MCSAEVQNGSEQRDIVQALVDVRAWAWQIDGRHFVE
jgi:hypothetical protein